MALQRCIMQKTAQYLIKNCKINTVYRQTYSELQQLRYSSTRKYTDRHEWVTVEANIGKVGISNYAQESLGDVVFAQLPDPGTTLAATAECGALESVKAASEIYSPISGIVKEKNKEVEQKPGLINKSCYDKGWLFTLEITKPDELDALMTEKQYEEFLKTDAESMKS